MEPLDTRGLVALRAVAEAGSVAAAATALSWSQPTVNHHLRNLERRLGATLIDRSPRGSHPTTVGSLVVARATEILGLCDRLGAEVALWRESQAVPVRIGAVPTVGARVIPGCTISCRSGRGGRPATRRSRASGPRCSPRPWT